MLRKIPRLASGLYKEFHMKQGYILIDKPKNWTSHDVVNYIRKIVKQSNTANNLVPNVPNNLEPNLTPKRPKVGHAGTLDPFATGLLIVGISREATKNIDTFKNLSKTYIATLKLGETSDTYDPEGTITRTPDSTNQTPIYEDVFMVCNTFIGLQQQIPPMHSAKKIDGQKLYNLARKGIEIERKPNDIEIYDIKILKYDWPFLEIQVSCSKGTYIRSLTHDIGQKLGTGAYCHELRRINIGNYMVDTAIHPKELNIENIESYIF